MNGEMLIALCSAAASILGTFGGILVSSRLTIYRIEQLEKKVEKHNSLIERMYKVEDSVKSAHHRIDDIKEEIKDV